MLDNKEKSIIAIEEIKRAIAVSKGKDIEELILTDFNNIQCYYEHCNKEPIYTIGTLLPSVWFDEHEKKRLIPVIYASCIEHRFNLLDRIPAKTVSVIIRDVSLETHEIVSDMLKQALLDKEEKLVIYYT